MKKIDYSDIHSALVFQVLECRTNRDVTSEEFSFHHNFHGQSHLEDSSSNILSPNGCLCVI